MTRSYRRQALSEMASVQNQARRRGGKAGRRAALNDRLQSGLAGVSHLDGSRGVKGVEEEFTPAERRQYGLAMRKYRAAHGLTDGLRLSQAEFTAYLERRRAEDNARRGH